MTVALHFIKTAAALAAFSFMMLGVGAFWSIWSG